MSFVLHNFVIVIVTYNPDPDFFNQYLDFNDYQFIIVDNSDCLSANITTQLNAQPNVLLISNQQNLGIAKALNIGCQKALDLGYEYVITMDQDSRLTTAIINGTLSYLDGCVGSSNIAVISPLHVMQHGVKNRINPLAEVTYGINTMTSGNLLNLSIWQKLNGFNDALFIDMVDVDYYCRAMILGYKVVTLNHVTMQHNLGEMRLVNLGIFNLKVFNHNSLRKYYQIRNSLYILKKYSLANLGAFSLLTRFLFHAIVGVVFEESRLNKIKMICYGFLDFCRNKYGKY